MNGIDHPEYQRARAAMLAPLPDGHACLTSEDYDGMSDEALLKLVELRTPLEVALAERLMRALDCIAMDNENRASD